MIVDLIIIIFVGYLSRLFLSFGNYASDDFQTSFNIKSQKEKKWIESDLKNSIILGIFGDPKFFYFALAKIFKRNSFNYGYILNISFDIFVAIIIYFILSFQNNENIGSEYTLYLVLIYILSPSLHPLTARLEGIKSRSFGSFLSFLFVLCLFEILNGELIYIFPSSIIFYLIFISSAFAAQFSIFTLLGLIFFTKNFYLLIPLIFLIVLYFFNISKVKEITIHKLNHFIWYYNNYEGTTAGKLNKIKDILNLPKYLIKDKFKFFIILIRDNSFTSLLILNPSLVLLLILAHENQTFFTEYDIYNFCFFILVTTIVTFFITSFKPFLIFGQSVRYMEYALPFVILSINFFIDNNNLDNMFIVIISIQLFILFIIFLLKKKIYKNSNYKEIMNDHKEVIRNIEILENIKNKNILCVPSKLSFSFSQLSKNFFYYYPWVTQNLKIDGFKYMKEDSDQLYLPKKNIEKLFEKYSIDYVIIKNSLLNKYDLTKYKKIFSNRSFYVFKINAN